jgi:non-specific serine/threonine protein kinase/serine/threonine-protein kinase
MGEVWLAEQKEPVRRKVAFKVIKHGMDTKQVVARFEAERQALAVMDHPAVAKVLDAGSTPRGRPFFVMEYVPGVPITQHCDKHKLTIRQRLELFQLVCEGVRHAHQKAIIHRDLKPSNVLVSTQNDKPVPKIIDFGIAKATGQKLTDQTMQTQLGAIIGTPEYMSPEQADLTAADVDTRADVYSLGVMLYELLVGRLPFKSSELREASFESLRRKICEEDPPRPSTRVSNPTDESVIAWAASRKTEARTLRRDLSGDLDWITMKALEKDRARRYDSPADLAADIQRYLDNQPIVARPPSLGYRTRKFVRRNRFGVALVASLTLAMIAGTIGTSVGLVRARQEARKANAILDFILGALEEARPEKAKGSEPTIRAALDLAAEGLNRSFEDRPEVEATIREMIGRVHHEMGHYDEAEPHLRRAVALYRTEFGERDPRTILALGKLGRTLLDAGRYAEADAEFARLVPLSRDVNGEDHIATLELAQNLAAAYLFQQKYAEAEPILLDLIERWPDTIEQTKEKAKKDPRVTESEIEEYKGKYQASVNNLGSLYMETERYDEAEPLFVETRDTRIEELTDRHPRSLISTFNLGDLYLRQERYADAEPLIREALTGFREVLDASHPYTLEALDGLAKTLLGAGRYAEAEESALENLRRRTDRYGADDARTAVAIELLIKLYEASGRPEDAERLRD